MNVEINEMYIKWCPEVEEDVCVTPEYQLHLLGKTLEGMSLALKDFHHFNKYLQAKLRITDKQYMDMLMDFQLKVKGV